MKWRATTYNTPLKSAARRTTLPVFTTKLRNYYGREGDTIKLQCCVDGEPAPVVSWLKEGKPLLESDRIKVSYKLSRFYYHICLICKVALDRKEGGKWIMEMNYNI